MKKYLLSITALAAIILSQTPTVLAQTGQNTTNSNRGSINSQEVKDKIEQKLAEARKKKASKAALKKEKLEATKLKVCETKKESIVRRSTRLAERAERQLNNFEEKATRVQNYYTNRLVPRGITLSNYNDLLADIEAKAEAVQESTTSAKQIAESFDCNGDDPKGQLANFRTEMQNGISALKDFRTSIKNLIVAVRTAVAKAATSSATPSADN